MEGCVLGDVRFGPPFERVQDAEDPMATIEEMSDEDVISALAGSVAAKEPYLANVLATEAMNRVLRASAVTASLGEGVLAINRESEIERANPAAASLLGWSEEELLNRKLHDVLHPEEAGLDDEGCPLTAPGPARQEGASVFARRDGSTFAVEFTQTPLLRHGMVQGAVLIFHDTTETRRAQRALEEQQRTLEKVVDRALAAGEERRRAESRVKALLEGAPDPIVIVDEEGRITLANSQVERVFGYARSEIVGKHVEVLMPERFRQGHNLHRRGYIQAPVARPMGTGLELYGLRANGEEFPVEISLSPVETEGALVVMAAIRDVTEREAAAARLRRSQALLKEAQMLAGIGSWEWDLDRDRVEVSDELARIFGIPPGRILDSAATSLIAHPSDRERVSAVNEEAIRTGKPFSYFYRITRPDREVRILHARGEVVTDENGRAIRVVGTAQDVTEQRRIEEETRARNALLEAQMASRTQELEALRGDLEGAPKAVAMDLRRAAEKVEALALELGDVAGARPRRMEELVAEARAVQECARHLDDLSTVTRAELRWSEVDLSALARGLVEDFRGREPDRGVAVEVEAGLKATADPDLIEVALRSILRLAWEGTRRTPRPRIRIGARPGIEGLEFYVQDNGEGISRLQAPRPGEGLESRGPGTPLALAQRVIQRHGGRLQGHGERGWGSTVFFTIPPPRRGPRAALSETSGSED